jgi:hypothetical protein
MTARAPDLVVRGGRSFALVYPQRASGAAFVTHHVPGPYVDWFDGAVLLDGQVLRDVLLLADAVGLTVRFAPAIEYTA